MKTIVETRHGLMAIYHEHDYISQCLLKQKQYEWYVVDIVQQLCDPNTPGCILDIGANIGTKCLPLAKLFPAHKIHAWEIQPHLVDILDENIELNSIDNIDVYNCGLGSQSATIEITAPDYESTKNIGAFSINPVVHQHSDISQGHGETFLADIKTLDSYNFKMPIQCIKIDAEGSELDILTGSLQTLEKHNYPPIVYELWRYNSWWATEAQKIADLIGSMGYQTQRIDDTAVCVKKK
jgi:FkbM family methyltransferase